MNNPSVTVRRDTTRCGLREEEGHSLTQGRCESALQANISHCLVQMASKRGICAGLCVGTGGGSCWTSDGGILYPRADFGESIVVQIHCSIKERVKAIRHFPLFARSLVMILSIRCRSTCDRAQRVALSCLLSCGCR